ncbi:MAG: hypothetical protein NTY41_06560 [Proteobacteria bacterium]|nr:hypothetical protein [Pseudomonadota bacterium]
MIAKFSRIPQLFVEILLGMLVACSTGAHATDDSAALAGLKEGKIAFDIHEGNPKLLLGKLNVIDETRQSLIQQGVKPRFIVAFRGASTRLVQTDQEMIKPEDREMASKIAERIKEMSRAPGVEGFEQCAVASRAQETKTELVLPDIQVVGNGFISLMAYQARGYAKTSMTTANAIQHFRAGPLQLAICCICIKCGYRLY